MINQINYNISRIIAPFDRFIRYFGVGIINSLVGFALYAGFVALVKNIYISQFFAHILGVIFNFFMLRTHVFRGEISNIKKYVFAYIFNYAMGLASLLIIHSVIESPYLAGVMSMFLVAVINYFVLKKFVFKSQGV